MNIPPVSTALLNVFPNTKQLEKAFFLTAQHVSRTVNTCIFWYPFQIQVPSANLVDESLRNAVMYKMRRLWSNLGCQSEAIYLFNSSRVDKKTRSMRRDKPETQVYM